MTPNDGDIDPSQMTQALAKGARDLGARILRFTPAIGVRREGDEWVVETGKGEIRCEYVVNAAGYYTQRVGEWFRPYGGRCVPMMVMSHQYMLTDEIPELEAWSREGGKKLPLLRDVDTSYYLRQEKYGLNLGLYEKGCKAHWVTPDDLMPDDFSFQLYPDDLERLEWYIEDAMPRVPILDKSADFTGKGAFLAEKKAGVVKHFVTLIVDAGGADAPYMSTLLHDWRMVGETVVSRVWWKFEDGVISG